MCRQETFDEPRAVAGSDLEASVREEAHLDEHDVDKMADEHGADDADDDHVHDADDADDVDYDGSAHLDDGGAHQEVLQGHHHTTGLLSFSAMQQMIYLFVK